MADEDVRRRDRDRLAQQQAGGIRPPQAAPDEGALASMRYGLPFPLDHLVNKKVYLDGVRMSWFVRLVGVANVYGEAVLLCHPMMRVGNFDDGGPSAGKELWNTTEACPGMVFLRDVCAITRPKPAWDDKLDFPNYPADPE